LFTEVLASPKQKDFIFDATHFSLLGWGRFWSRIRHCWNTEGRLLGSIRNDCSPNLQLSSLHFRYIYFANKNSTVIHGGRRLHNADL